MKNKSKRFTVLLGCVCIIALPACGQTQKILSVDPADNGKKLYNEFWSYSKGPAAAVYFTEYFFARDGTYTYRHGYSGGAYWVHETRGTYRYDPAKKRIKMKGGKGKMGKMNGRDIISLAQCPAELTLANISDSRVTAAGDPPAAMYRTVATTTDQYWFKGPDSSHEAIDFQLFGQLELTQEKPGRQGFVCTYHLVGDYLLLETRSRTINDQSDRFDPEIRTYLKVRVKADSVLVESTDLNEILDGKRNWTFKDMKFYINDAGPAGKTIQWDHYKRVRGGTLSDD